MEKTLKRSEWIFVGAFLVSLISIILISKINAHKACAYLPEKEYCRKVSVKIDGAVKKPGVYIVMSGTPLFTILKRAKPLPNADIKNFPIEQVAEEAIEIHVGALEEITIYIEGVGERVVKAGTRRCDLKGTDGKAFRGKKELRDGEKIGLSRKTLE